MDRNSNVAVIGAGMWGRTHIEMFQAESRANVNWVCDLNFASVEATCEKFGVNEGIKIITRYY